jgi:gliding motility-associated-like protein
MIEASAIGGVPPYTFSINGVDFQPDGTFSGMTAANYTVTVQDDDGCVFTVISDVPEGPPIVVTASAAPSVIELGESTTLDATTNIANIASIGWSPPANVDCISCLNTSASPTLTTNYTVTITDDNGCTGMAEVEVEVIENQIVVPNAFSPNGDGANDAFVISITGTSLIESLKAEVFNRWGMLIARKEFLNDSQALNTNNQELTEWDGRTTAGAELPESTYYYIVTYTKKTGETIVEKSSLTLLR